MQAKAIELAKEACTNEKMSVSPREIAGHLKLAFDELYGPAWHCVVGRSYGSFVTHGMLTLYKICSNLYLHREGKLHLLLCGPLGYHAVQDRIINR